MHHFILYLLQITSVLIITQISSELADPEGTGGTVGILLGLDIDEFKNTMSGEEEDLRKEKGLYHCTVKQSRMALGQFHTEHA